MLIPIQYEDPCTSKQRIVYVDHDEISVIVDYNVTESKESIDTSIMFCGTSKDVHLPLSIDKVYDIIKQAVGDDKCTIVKMSPSCYVNMKHVASISVDECSETGTKLLVSGYDGTIDVPNMTPSSVLNIAMNPQRYVQCNFVVVAESKTEDEPQDQDIVKIINDVMVDLVIIDSNEQLDLSTRLEDYKLTSWDFEELIVELEIASGVTITTDAMKKFETIKDIHDYLVCESKKLIKE